MSFLETLESAFACADLGKRTREAYRWWLRKFYKFHRKPASQWSGPDVEAWIHHLDANRYSAVSRKQALCAVAFAFKHALKRDMGQLALPAYPIEHHTLRTVPTRDEIAEIFKRLHGQVRLMAGLLYGAGLRVSECCELRVQDIDFAAATIRVHCGKGQRSRLTLLPVLLAPYLQRHIAARTAMHERDVLEGNGLVCLPGRLAQKYRGAPKELRWQYLFPSTAVRDGHRWHATPESVAKQMRAAVKGAGLIKRITPHTLRHAFATHSLLLGNDISSVQQLMGHESVETTMIYVHVDTAHGVSPLDVGRDQDARFSAARVTLTPPRRVTFPGPLVTHHS
jgi:integron integrase